MNGLFIPKSQMLQARAHFIHIANTRKSGKNREKSQGENKDKKNHNSKNNRCRDLWLVPFERKKNSPLLSTNLKNDQIFLMILSLPKNDNSKPFLFCEKSYYVIRFFSKW